MNDINIFTLSTYQISMYMLPIKPGLCLLYGRIGLLLCVFVFAAFVGNSQNVTVWSENFEGNSVGDRQSISNNPQQWSVDLRGASGNKCQVNTTYGDRELIGNYTQREVRWNSVNFNISNYSNVRVFIDLIEVGGLETSGSARDFIRCEYRLNNSGNWITFQTNGNRVGNFNSVTASTNNINANSLQLRIRMKNTGGDESYRIDNIRVNGNIKSDNTAPVFQNPQGNMTVNVDAGMCGANVDYTIPQATDNRGAFTGNIGGYNYLGQRNGHSYYYSTASLNYNSANQQAQNLRGRLLCVNSSEENNWINSRVGEIWLGYTDVASEGNFVWESGEPLDYENWNGGEPNNSGNEDHVVMYGGGTWNDLKGTNSRRYVVEFQPVTVRQTEGLPPDSMVSGRNNEKYLCGDRSGRKYQDSHFYCYCS